MLYAIAVILSIGRSCLTTEQFLTREDLPIERIIIITVRFIPVKINVRILTVGNVNPVRKTPVDSNQSHVSAVFFGATGTCNAMIDTVFYKNVTIAFF